MRRSASTALRVEWIGRSRIHIRVALEHAENRQRDAKGFAGRSYVAHDRATNARAQIDLKASSTSSSDTSAPLWLSALRTRSSIEIRPRT